MGLVLGSIGIHNNMSSLVVVGIVCRLGRLGLVLHVCTMSCLRSGSFLASLLGLVGIQCHICVFFRIV